MIVYKADDQLKVKRWSWYYADNSFL